MYFDTYLNQVAGQSSHVNFAYIAQHHKFASTGLIICTVYENIYPYTQIKD